jgi:hypothetical protein
LSMAECLYAVVNFLMNAINHDQFILETPHEDHH